MEKYKINNCEEIYAEYERFYDNGENFRDKMLLFIDENLDCQSASGASVGVWNDEQMWYENWTCKKQWHGETKKYRRCKLRKSISNKQIFQPVSAISHKSFRFGVPFYWEKEDWKHCTSENEILRIKREIKIDDNCFVIFNNLIKFAKTKKNQLPIYHINFNDKFENTADIKMNCENKFISVSEYDYRFNKNFTNEKIKCKTTNLISGEVTVSVSTKTKPDEELADNLMYKGINIYDWRNCYDENFCGDTVKVISFMSDCEKIKPINFEV